MRAIALLLVVLATLPMSFVRPIVGLILWIGFSYMNPHRITYGFATGFPWVMIVALVTLFTMALHSRQRQPMPAALITVLMVLFVCWTGVTTLTAVEGEMAAAKWIEFFKITLMAFVTLILVVDKRHLHWVIWAIVLSFGFWGFKGGLFTLASGGGYHVLGPIKSFFRDNNDFALVMCMTLPLMRYLQLYEKQKWIRYGLWVLMGLTVVSILGTQSRGGFLALAAVAFMLLLKSRRRAGLAVVGVFLAAAAISFMPAEYFDRINTIKNYEEVNTANTRLESWAFATNVAIGRPLTGGGFNIYANHPMWAQYGPEGATPRAIHSIYFQVLGEHGFIGLGLFLSMLGATWMSLARIRKQARAGPDLYWMGDLASMIQVSLVGFVAAGAFLPMAYFDLFYQLIALGVILQLFMKRVSDESLSDHRPAATTGYAPTNQRPPGAVDSPGRSLPEPASRRQPTTKGVRNLPNW